MRIIKATKKMFLFEIQSSPCNSKLISTFFSFFLFSVFDLYVDIIFFYLKLNLSLICTPKNLIRIKEVVLSKN